MTEHKALHFKKAIRRHVAIPYLWRCWCWCGWNAIAANELAAQQALDHHITEEEPFPDLGLEPEPGSGADHAKKEKGP